VTNKEELQSQFKTYECRIRRGVTQFVSEYMNKSRGFVSENNCELIDWIMARIEASFCDAEIVIRANKLKLSGYDLSNEVSKWE